MTLPNETTLSAMKEAESGEDAGIVNIDSVVSFIASMIWRKKIIESTTFNYHDNRKYNF